MLTTYAENKQAEVIGRKMIDTFTVDEFLLFLNSVCDVSTEDHARFFFLWERNDQKRMNWFAEHHKTLQDKVNK
jgi:hypothetical protein